MASGKRCPGKRSRIAEDKTVDRDSLTADPVQSNARLCWKPELSYFDSYPLSQTCVENSEFILFDPLAPVGDTGTIEFQLPSSREHVYDPANIRFWVDLKIKKRGGQDVLARTKPPEAAVTAERARLRIEIGKAVGRNDVEIAGDPLPEVNVAELYDPVTVSNQCFHSMIQRVEVELNQRQVASTCGDHHLR